MMKWFGIDVIKNHSCKNLRSVCIVFFQSIALCTNVSYIWANLLIPNGFFVFLFLVTFGDEIMKMQKYYVIFVYILQGKMGKSEKTERNSRN